MTVETEYKAGDWIIANIAKLNDPEEYALRERLDSNHAHAPGWWGTNGSFRIAIQDDEIVGFASEIDGVTSVEVDSVEDVVNHPAHSDGVVDPGGEVDYVNSPPHYTSHPSGLECYDIVRHLDFTTGNAIKYLWRSSLKGKTLEDLQKAQWYVNNIQEIPRGVFNPAPEVLKELILLFATGASSAEDGLIIVLIHGFIDGTPPSDLVKNRIQELIADAE